MSQKEKKWYFFVSLHKKGEKILRGQQCNEQHPNRNNDLEKEKKNFQFI